MTNDADTRVDRGDRNGTHTPDVWRLDHVTVENEHAPDECAIFPREASDEELTTNWIAALEGSFLTLETMR